LNQIENHQQEISIFDLARQAVLADERLVREVLLDRRPPWFMEKGADDLQKLKYLSNQLPGERERSLAALELVTEFTLELLDAISVEIMPGLELGKDDGGAALRSFFSVAPESRLEPAYQFAVRSHSGRSWAKFQMANLATDHCGTSWLLAEELEDYSRLDSFLFTLFEAEIRQRMLLNQLALVAYRLDHGEYPGSLEALVPEYLLALPLDPFSDSPFQYYAKGISPPLWDGGKLYEGGPLLCSLGWRASADAELVRSFEEVPIDPEAELPLGEIRETQLMEVSEFRYGVRINTLPPVIDEP
jgi:hypothetical protein